MKSSSNRRNPQPAGNTDRLNPRQKAAAEAPSGPLLIVAGAGTGKTRTLAARLVYFIRQGTTPERICAITFTNKAAKEMASRVAATYDKKPMTNNKVIGHKSVVNGPFIGTFHSLGARILRAEAHLLGRKRSFTIFDGHDSFDLIKKITKRLVSPAGTGRKNPGGDGIGAATKSARDTKNPAFFAQKISEIKNNGHVLKDLERSKSPADILALKVFYLYEKNLEENNAFDFDDLIEKPVKLFHERRETLEKYQRKFDIILVDEYQDVSPMQYELIKLLAENHKNLSVVGDDEQLIYGWRYANLGIFLDFEKDWPGAHVAFLEENYRSTGNIIRASSEVSKNNLGRRPKNLWTKNHEGAPIKLAEIVDESEEGEWIAKTISNLQFPIFNETTAVLYRTNAQSRALEQSLIRHGIPYQIFGGLKFYERKEIKDIVAAMRFLVNHSDSLGRERLEKNFSKTKFSEIEKICLTAGKKSSAPVEFIEQFLKATGYLDYLERNFANYSERQENVAELLRFAMSFKTAEDMLQEIALVQATDIATNDKRQMTHDNSSMVISHKSSVHLSTIHLAKGLEFDRVFIAGCSEGLLPHERSIENEAQLEEERRLMYVAMTRAKKELYISFYDLPSRFLSEIPQELIELDGFSQDGGLRLDDEENFIPLPE